MMTYWIVMYLPPVNKGMQTAAPIKMKTTRAYYEIASRMERATVTCEKGRFKIIEKKIFTLEVEQMCFLIAEVERQDR